MYFGLFYVIIVKKKVIQHFLTIIQPFTYPYIFTCSGTIKYGTGLTTFKFSTNYFICTTHSKETDRRKRKKVHQRKQFIFHGEITLHSYSVKKEKIKCAPFTKNNHSMINIT